MLMLALKGLKSVKFPSLKVIKFTNVCRVGAISVPGKFRDFVDRQYLRFLFTYHL